MTHFRLFLPFACLMTGWLSACKPQPKDLPQIDEKAFAEDQKGCNMLRLKQKDALFGSTSDMRGMSEDEMVATLGKPDATQLADRSQKFYIYYIEPAPDCEQTTDDKPLTMYIRFSALGFSKEVTFKNY